jgi:hypothetical protein
MAHRGRIHGGDRVFVPNGRIGVPASAEGRAIERREALREPGQAWKGLGGVVFD